MKYVYIWQFEAIEGKETEFEDVYGSVGAWVKLFQRDSNYLQTMLIRDIQIKGRYLTVDIWKNRESFNSFKESFKSEFEALDKQCESLTTVETKIGEYAVME